MSCIAFLDIDLGSIWEWLVVIYAIDVTVQTAHLCYSNSWLYVFFNEVLENQYLFFPFDCGSNRFGEEI